MLKLFHVASGSSFQVAFCVLLTCPHCFLCFLTFGARYSKFILHFSVQPWNQSFLQGVLVPFSKKPYSETEIWILGVFIPIGISLLPDHISVQSWEIYAYILNLYTHIQICIYFCICRYMLETMCSHCCPQSQSNTTRFILVFFLSKFGIAFF